MYSPNHYMSFYRGFLILSFSHHLFLSFLEDSVVLVGAEESWHKDTDVGSSWREETDVGGSWSGIKDQVVKD